MCAGRPSVKSRHETVPEHGCFFHPKERGQPSSRRAVSTVDSPLIRGGRVPPKTDATTLSFPRDSTAPPVVNVPLKLCRRLFDGVHSFSGCRPPTAARRWSSIWGDLGVAIGSESTGQLALLESTNRRWSQAGLNVPHRLSRSRFCGVHSVFAGRASTAKSTHHCVRSFRVATEKTLCGSAVVSRKQSVTLHNLICWWIDRPSTRECTNSTRRRRLLFEKRA